MEVIVVERWPFYGGGHCREVVVKGGCRYREVVVLNVCATGRILKKR